MQPPEKPEAAIPDDLMIPSEAASLLGVSTPTIYRWILGGKLPAWRVGGRKLRVSKADVVGMLKPVEPKAKPRPPSRFEQRVHDACLAGELKRLKLN